MSKQTSIKPIVTTEEIPAGFRVRVNLDGLHASMVVSTRSQAEDAEKAYKSWRLVGDRIITVDEEN